MWSIELRAQLAAAVELSQTTNWQPQAGSERRLNMCHMLSLCGSRLGTCPVVGAGRRPVHNSGGRPGIGPTTRVGTGHRTWPSPAQARSQDRAWVGTRAWA